MLRLWLPAISVLVLFSALVAACGGDDGGSDGEADELTAYFQQLSAIAALGNVQIESLEQRFPAAFDEVEPTKQYYAEYVVIYEGLVKSAGDLTPPDNVAEQHEAYVTASRELQQAVQSRLEQLDGAASKDDLDAIFAADNKFEEAVTKQDFACSELKRIADEEAILVPGLGDCKNFN